MGSNQIIKTGNQSDTQTDPTTINDPVLNRNKYYVYGISLYIHISHSVQESVITVISFPSGIIPPGGQVSAAVTEWNLVCRQLAREIQIKPFISVLPLDTVIETGNYITSSLIQPQHSPDLEFSVGM